MSKKIVVRVQKDLTNSVTEDPGQTVPLLQS